MSDFLEPALSQLLVWHDHEDTLLPETEEPIVKELVEGVIAHNDLLKAMLAFIQVDGDITLMRREYALYEIVLYLFLFRLEELSFPIWAELIVLKLPPPHTTRILAFLLSYTPEFNTNTQHVLDNTIHTVYHHEHAQKLLQHVFQHAYEIHQLNSSLQPRQPDTIMPSRRTKKATKPQPFTLTQPSRPITIKHRKISTLVTSKPAPPSTYRPSLLPAQPQKKLLSHFTPPVVVESPRPALAKSITVAPVPVSLNQQPLHIAKQTNSTILRASYLLSKKLESKVDAHITLFDGEVLRSIELRKADDAEKSEAAREKSRLEVLIGREIAIEKKKESEAQKSELAAQGKIESQELARKREEDESIQADQNRQLIKAIQISEEAAKEAVKKAVEEKQKLAMALAAEHARTVKQAQEEIEQERQHRIELMKQIRIMEAKAKEERANRPKEVDLTSPEKGIMGEMSVLQLQERLEKLRVEEEELQMKKRQDIIDLRREQAEAMARKIKELEVYRRIAKERSTETTSNVTSLRKDRSSDPQIEVMRLELERRRAERLGQTITKVNNPNEPKIIN